MPKYKVKSNGFYGGIFRTPGGKHDPVVTAKPIPKKEMPSWLEVVKPLEDKKKAAEEVTEPNEKVANFLGDEDNDGVETL